MRRCATLYCLASLAVLLAAGQLTCAQELVVTPDKPLGVYAAKEPITWTVELRGAPASEVHYVLKKNGYTVVREGALPLYDGKGALRTALAEPGWMLAEFSVKVGEKEVSALGGAAVDPAGIGPSAPRPKDFDAFWKAKLAELAKTPADPVVEAADSGRPDLEYYKVRMNNIRGSHIYGQLAKPKGKQKLPALLVVQWAGVYGLQQDWVTWRAEQGWLVLNIMAHDLPFDQPEEFYQKLSETTLKNYTAIGNESRETSYFLRMYLSCYRAAEYLTQRPDWDGKTLVVTGGSQGGLQSIVTAALHPKVTAVIASVPAGCDTTGPEANRASGWPHWYWQTEGKDKQKVWATARYFDVVNFASRVKCPTLVGLGLVDTTCPASGVYAMTNQLRGPKEVIPMATAGHNDGDHRAFEVRSQEWLEAMQQGQAPPVHAGAE